MRDDGVQRGRCREMLGAPCLGPADTHSGRGIRLVLRGVTIGALSGRIWILNSVCSFISFRSVPTVLASSTSLPFVPPFSSLCKFQHAFLLAAVNMFRRVPRFPGASVGLPALIQLRAESDSDIPDVQS